MKIRKFKTLLIALIINICGLLPAIQAACANGTPVYTSFDLTPYQTDDGNAIHDIHLETSFCSASTNKKRLCIEEENICHEVFAYLKEKLQTVAEEQNFRLYGCSADEMHVPRQERGNALFIEYQLHATEKTMFKQPIPFNIYVLRSLHKRWKDGEGYSSREMYPPFPIPETDNWDAFRQDLLTRIRYDIDEVVRRVNWKTISQKTLNIPKLSQDEIIYGMKVERVLSKSSSMEPEELFDIYLKAKEAAQRSSGLRPNYLNTIETFLQEHKLLDEKLEHQNFIKQFVDETIALHKNNPDKILSIYQRLKALSALDNQSEIPYLRLYEVPSDSYFEPYESYLNKEGLLP